MSDHMTPPERASRARVRLPRTHWWAERWRLLSASTLTTLLALGMLTPYSMQGVSDNVVRAADLTAMTGPLSAPRQNVPATSPPGQQGLRASGCYSSPCVPQTHAPQAPFAVMEGPLMLPNVAMPLAEDHPAFPAPASRFAAATGCTATACAPLALATQTVDRTLLGRWVWIADSDGTKPAAGSDCSIFVVARGSIYLNCVSPTTVFNDQGTYTISSATTEGGVLTLTLPGVPLSVTAKPYRRGTDTLTLPFMLISTGEGTSRWLRQAPVPADSPDFAAVAFDTYDQAIANGADDGAAAEAAAAALRARRFPSQVSALQGSSNSVAGVGGGSLAAATHAPLLVPLRQVMLNADKDMLRVNQSGRTYDILLKTGQADDVNFSPRPATEPLHFGFFASDPRTNMPMQRSAGPDDPSSYTASLMFPFQTQRIFTARGGSESQQAAGQKPEELQAILLKAGYRKPDVIPDDKVTVRAIYDALLKNPGIFYISTHGNYIQGDFVLMTGQRITAKAGEPSIGEDGEPSDITIQRTIREIGLPAEVQQGLGLEIVDLTRLPQEHATFLTLSTTFFKALRAYAGASWNLSKSLVYIDACKSAEDPNIFQQFQAGAYIGWDGSPDPVTSAHFSEHFFLNAARKTHSAREVWNEIQRVLASRQLIYPEDALLDSKDPVLRTMFVRQAPMFRAYGQDGKPYKPISTMVFWLVWLGRWNQNPNTASNALQNCFGQFWSLPKKGGITEPGCNAGILGTHVPTKAEVQEARQLINGQPRPIPGGRWTMADHLGP